MPPDYCRVCDCFPCRCGNNRYLSEEAWRKVREAEKIIFEDNKNVWTQTGSKIDPVRKSYT